MSQQKHTDARLPNDAKGGTGVSQFFASLKKLPALSRRSAASSYLLPKRPQPESFWSAFFSKSTPWPSWSPIPLSLSLRVLPYDDAVVRVASCYRSVAVEVDGGALRSANCCDRAPGAFLGLRPAGNCRRAWWDMVPEFATPYLDSTRPIGEAQ